MPSDEPNIEMFNRPITANNTRRCEKDVRATINPNESFLFDIVANNQSEKLLEAISNGANVNIKAMYTNENLLHIAASYGATECAKILIKEGINVNSQTDLVCLIFIMFVYLF